MDKLLIDNLPDCRITLKQLHAVVRFLMNSKRDSISFKLFISLISDGEPDGREMTLPEINLVTKEILNWPMMKWADFRLLSVRAKKVMQRLNITTIKDLVSHTEGDILKDRNAGQTTLSEIKTALAKSGLSLKVEDE